MYMLKCIGLNPSYIYVLISSLCNYSRLSPSGHLYKTDTSVKWTPRVGPFLSLLPLFDSL